MGMDVEGFVEEIFYRQCKDEGFVGELAQSPLRKKSSVFICEICGLSSAPQRG
jgi:hypothetical protein